MGNILQGRELGVACLIAASATFACGGTDDVNDDNSGSGAMSATGGSEGGTGGTDSGDGGTDAMSGGSAGEGSGGDSGTGGSPLVLEQSNKIDVLFVVDNSVSMDDEHTHLIPSARRLFENLANPPCTSTTGAPVASSDGHCPDGYTIAFSPRRDMHVGVITTSIGGRGSDNCRGSVVDRNWDDRAYLIPKIREGVTDPHGNGILSWKGGTPKALLEMSEQLGEHLAAAGTSGCGFEAPLESMYRFLVDPSPDQDVVVGDNSQAASTGVDQEILEQRAVFLRPDSSLIVVMLSDEDDCSMMAGGSHYKYAGYGYLTAKTTTTGPNPFFMSLATEPCQTDPNDKCCFSCLQARTAPAGCEDAAAICEDSPQLAAEHDRTNVRCFDQKKRFGVDFLYPVERYIDGLSDVTIVDSQSGEEVKNPLFHNAEGEQTRDPDWVYLLSIVGVPWQDLATPESLINESKLEYLSAAELDAENLGTGQNMANRWEAMLGDPTENRPPLDPFMVASIAERTGGSPIVVDGSPIASIVPSSGSGWNVINGHETKTSAITPSYEAPANDDLQFACIYPRTTPLTDCVAEDPSCDCGEEPLYNRATCSDDQDAATPATRNQYYGKGYPGLRELSVVRGLGERGVPGSICPKIIDPAEEDGAYHPAVDALLARLGTVLK